MATTNQMQDDTNTIGLWHLDGTSGSAGKLLDSHSGGTNLTDGSTAPTATTGQIVPTTNGASVFASSANQYHTIGDPSYFPAGSFTIECWLYLNGTPADSQGVITKYGSVGTRSFAIQRNTDNTLTFAVSSNGSTTVNLNSPAISTGAWQYFAFVFTASSKLEIYIDGVFSSENTTSIPSSIHNGTSSIDFGAYEAFRSTANNVFNGYIDEVRFSNVARTATEISNYWNNITNYSKVLFETSANTDTARRSLVRTRSETATATDSVTRGLAYLRTLLESTTITDTILKYLNGSLVLWNKLTKNTSGSWTKGTKDSGSWNKQIKNL